MEIKYLLTVAELVLAVGDDPGHSARHYSTSRTADGTSVNQLKLAKLKELQARGLVADEGKVVRGRPASSLKLTTAGRSVYALLAALRELPAGD